MKALGFVLAGMLALAACGDNIKPGGGDGGMGDGGTDGDVDPDETFTTFVIDLIQNQTMNNTAPVPYSAFETLPDPDKDTNNVDAYDVLFP